MLNTHVGNLLINDALPEDLRQDQYRFDKKGVHEVFQQLAEKHPEKYKEVLKKLSDIGRDSAYTTGTSVNLEGLGHSPAKEAVLGEARQKLQSIIESDKISDTDKEKHIIDTLLPLGPKLQDALFEEAKKEDNPYYLQLISGARGKKSDYNSLRGADLLTSDQNGKIIPIPILNSYADGLDPVEYWAGLYGQRRGAVGTKFATADAGYVNKRLTNATHRMVVDKEAPEPTRVLTGLPVSPKDKDSVGSVLAKEAGPYPAGTLLTEKMLKDLDEQKVDEIVIHSPMTESSEDGGMSRLAAGRRDRFGLSKIGDNIGVPAAQAVGEKLSQGSLGSKHQSGVVGTGANRAGFEVLNRMIEGPEHFPEAGPLAEVDGHVKSVEKAPQGGHYITVGEHQHYVHPDVTPIVKPGDQVEAGDSLTDGLPHPADLVRHKGLGEARRIYLGHMREILDNSGVPAHRRNLEAIVGGLLNQAEVTDPEGIDGHVVDDVVSYGSLAHGYKPRPDAKLAAPTHSIGRYLEEPALHYTPGSLVTKSVAKHLTKHGIGDVYTHEHEPGFKPVFQRSIIGLHSDDDWSTGLSGFYTASGFSKALSRGATSDPHSTSYIPALAKGTDFGQSLSTTGKYGPSKA